MVPVVLAVDALMAAAGQAEEGAAAGGGGGAGDRTVRRGAATARA